MRVYTYIANKVPFCMPDKVAGFVDKLKGLYVDFVSYCAIFYHLRQIIIHYWLFNLSTLTDW